MKQEEVKLIRKELREWNKLAIAMKKNKDTLSEYGKGYANAVTDVVKNARKKLNKLIKSSR